MDARLNRRRFLETTGTGIAAGVAASTACVVLADDDPPSVIPLPDSETKQPTATTEPQPVCCTPAATLIFPCSGAADVGEIADHAARKLNADGVGKMSCLAGIGGRVPQLMEIARGAQVMLAIDGCPLRCASNTLKTAGFEKFVHVGLADLGLEKGKTPATPDAVAKVVDAGKGKLTLQSPQK